jgi:hypothetical protein
MSLSPLRFALAVILVVAAFSASAQAKVLLVCGQGPAAQPASFTASSPLQALSGLSRADESGKQTALVRTESGYDVVLDWGSAGSHGLRERGYDIVDSEVGEMVHLLLPGEAQHFLFSFENERFGEVVWTSPSSGESEPRRFPCIAP